MNEVSARQEKKYDVDRAAFLLRWVGLYASRPDADIKPALDAVKKFLDDICPSCGGRGDYIDAQGDKEPCDDCGIWTGQTVVTYVGGVNTELLEALDDALELLVWASGAFDTQERSRYWDNAKASDRISKHMATLKKAQS